MRKLAAAIAISALAIALAPTASVATEPSRVMLLGDSVSHGLDGEYTWRYFAWKGLQQTGASVDFVGPHIGTWSQGDEFGGAYANPDFDQDHAARYGLSMWETLYWHNAETAPPVADLMAYDPDVIVNTLGVNDLLGMNQTPEQAIDHSRKIIEQARAINPDVDFVLGSLPQVWFERVPVYNDLLPALADELTTTQSRVVVTPTAQWVNRVDTYDDAHPTTLGQRKVAQAVSAGLEKLGIGRSVLMTDPSEPEVVEPVVVPEPPAEVVPPMVMEAAATTPAPVVTPAVAPESPRRVRATRDGRRAIVTWRTVDSADAYKVRCGTRATVVDSRKAVLRSAASQCKVRSVSEAGESPWAVVRVRTQR